VFDKGDGKCDPTVIPGGGKRDLSRRFHEAGC